MRRKAERRFAALAVLVCAAGPLRAQDAGDAGPEVGAVDTAAAGQALEVELAPAAYAAIVGLYVFDDGRRLEIFDVVDQLGENQLVGVEPGTGRVRTLYPLADTLFEAGPAWFVREPVEYRLRFGHAADGGIARVVRQPVADVAAEPEAAGRRVRFRERQVAFRNGDVRLAGTVVLPEGDGPHPGVILVHGSGPVTRRLPRYMADLFAHRGIAALVYDKRGAGESTGEWQGAAHEALAADARAAVEMLRAQPEVDPERVGLFGASEGGYVAPVAASRDPDIAFLVCRVCPALPMGEVAPGEQAAALRRAGYSDAEVANAETFHRRLIEYSLHGTGRARLEADFERWKNARWMRRFGWDSVPPPDARYWEGFRGLLVIDPREHYRELSIPVLVVLGERDVRIPVERHRPVFEMVREASDSPDFSIEVMPNATHGLLVIRTGPDGERLPHERFAPAFHDLVVDWVAERMVER